MAGSDQISAGETYHFAGSEHCSWADFARGIIEASTEFGGKPTTVVPIATDDYPTPAIRPAYTVLDCGKFDREFGFERPGWTDAVRPVVAELMKGRVVGSLSVSVAMATYNGAPISAANSMILPSNRFFQPNC